MPQQAVPDFDVCAFNAGIYFYREQYKQNI